MYFSTDDPTSPTKIMEYSNSRVCVSYTLTRTGAQIVDVRKFNPLKTERICFI
jgi:hypothetical protein